MMRGLAAGEGRASKHGFRGAVRRAALGAFAALCALSLGGCGATDGAGSSAGTAPSVQEGPLTETGFFFDTAVTLTAYCDQELMDQALERCRYFEEHLSRTREGSDVWRINEAKGQPVEVAPETAEVIAQGIELGRRSEGLFDITIGAVSSLWDFKEGIRPSDEAIAEALAHVGYEGLSVEGTTVQLADPEAMVDLGGIAKGYIADELARLFHDGGCESAIINLGGNALVVGAKPDGSPWKVGVQDPNAPTDAGVIAVRECAGSSVVTSGLYERCFEQDGRSYHHILDPRTGYPVETDLVSVSVASESSLAGDAYATWMFLLGRDGALAFLEAQEGIEGLVMGADGTVAATAGSSFAVL